jgi:lipoprotein-anchoring transpeptidase ErfK/SrfK
MPPSPFRFVLTSVVMLLLVSSPGLAATKKSATPRQLSMAAVNDAEWSRGAGARSRDLLLKIQVLLDRAHASPGQIDATHGENTRKAIVAFREMRDLGAGEQIDQRLWQALVDQDSGPVLVRYIISEADVAGPFIDHVPEDFRDKAKLKQLSYTSAQELLAEKFHMSERLLQELNPGVAFANAGTEIVVTNVERGGLPRKIARVEVDAARQRVRAYDRDDRMILVYPATVGSRERASPTGEFKVSSIAHNPIYHYDPSLNLRGVDVDEKLELPPGPNNPVGRVWIGLSAKGYGIHGTPDPDAVSKRASHGCIRLTNWDALELAKHVSKGTPVTIGRATREARRGRDR